MPTDAYLADVKRSAFTLACQLRDAGRTADDAAVELLLDFERQAAAPELALTSADAATACRLIAEAVKLAYAAPTG